MPKLPAPVPRVPADASKAGVSGSGPGVVWPSAAPFLLPFLLTALAYLLAGVATFPLAIPPSYGAPFFPAAGIGLASVLIYGRRMLPAVLLGSLGVSGLQHLSGQPPHASTQHALLLAILFAAASSFQAGIGAFLVRRFVPQPLILEESRDVFGFIGAAALGCLAGSVPSNLAIWAAGSLPIPSLLLSTAIWWLGDLLGILVTVPICLTVVGRPREAWAPRRLSVGVTLLLVTLLLGAGIHQVSKWHRDRSNSAFDRDAASASRLLMAQLDEPLQALKSINSVFRASDDVDRREFHAATADWLRSGELLAIGWGESIRRDEVPGFEAQVRAADALPAFRVFDRRSDPPRQSTGDLVAIRFIEPRPGVNDPVIGLNVLSVPQLRTALLAARASSAPVASAAFLLTTVNEPGIVIYQAVPRRATPGAAATTLPHRSDPILGFVFTTIRLEQQIQALKRHIPSYLGACIIDTPVGSAPLRMAGPPACLTAPPSLRRSQPLAFAGRAWEIRIFAAPGSLPGTGDADVWLFALVGLLSTGMLGGFLLMMTGRTRRIETAVRERTAALQAEVREREATQDELRESEQRFRNILNNVPIGVIYTDLEGNVKQSNPRFCELLGYSEEELLSLNSRDYTYPEDLAHDIELTDKLLRGEVPMVRRHTRFVAIDGTVLWVQTTVTLLRDGGGVARRIVGVVEDVTEHMKLEEAERAREAAEASNRAKSDFLSRMSHELRTPLNAMLGFAQLLELDHRHPLSPTQQPWVAQIQRAGWHLLEMINDVLDLSRIESGNLRLQTETLNLAELVDACRSMVLADAERRGIAITVELGIGASNVLGDATRVKQILTNLLSNAVKYNVDGGRVQLVARVIGEDSVAISVSDTGLGMTSEQLGQLFQPFNRLGLEKSTLQGTGIGLVISQRLAELMGGSLRARSVAGEGSSFVLRLPSEAEPDTVPSNFDPMSKSPAEYHTRIVHYVEDNETNVEVMRGILAQRPQVALEVSVTGLDALAAIRARRPDLILLDMHLPDIDGLELLRYFKADSQLASVPVVIVSADALAHQIEDAKAVGCVRYLTKPVNVSALLRVVDDLLEEMETHFG